MNEWIDRSVRLPTERGEYLVYKAGIGKVEIANYGTRKHFENGRDDRLGVGNPYRITHWMPLPGPPDRHHLNKYLAEADAFAAAREMDLYQAGYSHGHRDGRADAAYELTRASSTVPGSLK